MVVLSRQLRFVEGPMVWAVTSHAKLRLIATDDFTQSALMGIHGWRWDNARTFTFAIDYALPDGEVPWPGARVSLETSDLSQACEMVAYGLSKATGTANVFRKPTDPAETAGPNA
jgi:hypothetical protein